MSHLAGLIADARATQQKLFGTPIDLRDQVPVQERRDVELVDLSEAGLILIPASAVSHLDSWFD